MPAVPLTGSGVHENAAPTTHAQDDERRPGLSGLSDGLGDEMSADRVDFGVEFDDDGRSRARRALDRKGPEQQERRREAHGGIIGSC